MGHEEYERTELARHHRALLRDLERTMPASVTRSVARLGETTGRMEGEHAIADRVLKMRVWMRDSALWAMESWARGSYVECLRGYVQARLYEGVLDGAGVYPHNCVTSDALSFLRNLCERAIRPL